MTEIRSINAIRANRENDNGLLSPIEALQDAIADIEAGETKCQSILILALDRGEDETCFDIKFNSSNLKSSEMLALLECMKARVLTMMNFIAEP
jgi:hypothetical protein